MDIGNPDEIPATRKKLPSMQELGAFDFGAPAGQRETPTVVAPASADLRGVATGAPTPAVAGPPGDTRRAAPVRPAAATSAPTRPAELDAGPASSRGASTGPATAPPRTKPTPEQLREALAKADPQTRQKLMRLIAGGRTVQQVTPAGSTGARRRNLVMQLDADSPRARGTTAPPGAPPPAPAPPPASGFGAFTASSRSAPGFARPHAGARPASRSAEPALMQIDEHTELLDAVAPGVSPDARKAELQAQLAEAQRQAAAPEPVRSEPLAHKALFPAYDPNRHGDDVHGASRRRHEGPIEGHFPAPRQPFKPSYRHPDGRPMTAEENQAEEVLQTQRCEETLSVLARDGVNGLLLSPRDLDAAVATGVLTAEAAATLWKTWSALRPVIHVIEDDPPSAPDASEDAGAAPPLDGTIDPVPQDERPPSAIDPAVEAVDAVEAFVPTAPPSERPADLTAPGGTHRHAAAQAAAADLPVEAPSPTPARRSAAAAHDEPHAGATGTLPPTVASAPAAAPPVSGRPESARPMVSAPDDEADPPTLPLPRTTLQAPPPWSAPSPPVAPPSGTPSEVAGDVIAPARAHAVPAISPRVETRDARRTRLRTLARAVFWAFVAYCVLATSARLAVMAWARWGHLIVG